jgi:multimeric flavodoxin WrbA
MGQQIIINGTHNTNGNTSQLIERIYPNTPSIKLLNYHIELYNYDEKYSEKDQFLDIVHQLLDADEIIFATPVYWYSMSSRLKIFFDRMTDLIGTNEKIGRKLMGKKMSVITTSNGNNLDENFFLPFIETANYLHLEYVEGKHYVNE